MLKRNDSLMSTRNCYVGGNIVKYIVVHYTGCYAPVKNFCLSQMNNDLNGSAHDFVGDNEWYCSIAHTNRAWSVGDDNGYGRFPNGITNSNTLNIEMVAKPYELPSAKTIENTAEIVAYYMKVYNVPLSRVVRHYDASYKPCPYGMHGNINAKWSEFKNKVNYYYNGAKSQQTTSGEMYRVRKSWADASSQIGAYSNKENAIKSCPSGYKVFDSKGNQIYPATTTTQTSGDLCRILVNGTNKIALTGLEKCKEYVKANYPKEKVEIQRVSDGKILFTQTKYVAPQPTKKYVNLSPQDTYWRVYKVGGKYTVGNEIGKLMPKTYGGLSYVVEKDLGNNVYQITTSSYGTVAIWCNDVTTYAKY